MSGRPPIATTQKNRKQRYLDDIKNGVAGAEEAYRVFLIEKGLHFFSLEDVLPDTQTDGHSLDSIIYLKDGTKRTDWASAFIRTKEPNYEAEGGQRGIKEFVTTKETMMKTSDALANENSKGHSSNAKKTIWNRDILARELTAVKTSEVAHLLPDVSAHAAEWYDVACWAMGVDPEKTDWANVLRLLHGTKGSNQKRVFGSGMRHFVANKARIEGKESLIDKTDPQLLLLPIRSRKQILDWNGEDYEAILLLGADKDGLCQDWATRQVGLTDVDNITVFEGNSEELQRALLSLEEFTYAMVQSLVNYNGPAVPANATEDEKERIEVAIKLRAKRREIFLAALGAKSIPVPKQGNTGPTVQCRAICKICFSNDKNNNFHPAPDPMLLLARATVIWSLRHGIRLRASAVAQDYYDLEEWENDVAQLEVMAKLQRERQLKEEVEGSELTVEQRGLKDSDSDISSASSL